MAFKVLIIISSVGFFCLLCDGKGSPYDAESLGGTHDVGELKVLHNSPDRWEITWRIDDFFSLPPYKELTQFYRSKDRYFHIYLAPKGLYEKEGFSLLRIDTYESSDSSKRQTLFPDVTCEFYVKTRDNKLYRALRDIFGIYGDDGHCHSSIPRSEIVGRNDSLVPEGVLTLVVKLHWFPNSGAPFQTADNVESNLFETQTEITEIVYKEMPERVGSWENTKDSGSTLEITWIIWDLFNLLYTQEVFLISPYFIIGDYHGYVAMDPKGSVSTPGFITFRSIIFRDHNRREKIYLQLYIKEKDGTLHKIEAREESQNYFVAHVPKSEIEVRKEEMVPGGVVLKLLFKLSSTDDDVNSRNSSNAHSSRGLPVSTDLPNAANNLSSENMSYDGVLEAIQRTDRSWEIKWKLKEFFILPQYRELSQYLDSEKFWFFVYMRPIEIFTADITTLEFNWRLKPSSNEKDFLFQEFNIQFYLRTKEGMLYSVPERECGFREYGGSCEFRIPRREILDRRDSLVHEGDLTIVGKIRWLTAAFNSESLDSGKFMKSEAPEESLLVVNNEVSTIDRVGEMKISRDTSTKVDITWKIPDFFTLSFRQDVGILSPNFRSSDFEGYLEMNPRGSVSAFGDIKFTGVILRQVYREEKVFCKFFLKDKDDVLHEFEVEEEFQTYFSSELPKPIINFQREKMAPGDVVTVVFKLSTTEDFGVDRKSASKIQETRKK